MGKAPAGRHLHVLYKFLQHIMQSHPSHKFVEIVREILNFENGSSCINWRLTLNKVFKISTLSSCGPSP